MQSQPLTTSALSAIKLFDGTDKSNTMSWLDQVEVVRERSNQTPLEVGMAKLKGAPLQDMHKTCDLTWPWLTKLLIENYSDSPYISDMMVTYNKISQAENESVSQYLMHAKDYLECINHIGRKSSMDGSGLNHISLAQGLSNSYVRRRASKGTENWRTMADAFDSITKIAKMAGKTKAYNEPRYEVSTDVNIILQHANSQRGSLVDTKAVTEVPVTAIEPTHIQGIIHPNKATPKNHMLSLQGSTLYNKLYKVSTR